MRAPTLRQLHSFVATVETGSLSAAARVLRITQPAASQQVKELERALATRLLQRGAGPVRPTAAGEAVLLQARRVQSAVEDLLSAAAAFQGGEIGRVRLGTGATACIYLLPPLLARMKQRMPGLEIVIATGNTSDMLGRVLSGSLDLALITLAGRSDAPSVRPATLAALPLILYEGGGATRGLVDAWFRRAALAPRPIMELGSVEAIKVLVESGLGATILPRSALAPADTRPPEGMRVVPLRPAAARCLAVVLRRDKLRDRGLRVCLEALETAAAGAQIDLNCPSAQA